MKTLLVLLALCASAFAAPITFHLPSPFSAMIQQGGQLGSGSSGGGGGITAFTCSAHNWASSGTSGGVFSCTQPAFSDVSGSLAKSQAWGTAASYDDASPNFQQTVNALGYTSSGVPSLYGTAGAAPTGCTAASIGCLFLDSTGNQWKSVFNNGSKLPLVLWSTTTQATANNFTLWDASGNLKDGSTFNMQGPAAAITGNSAVQAVYTFNVPQNLPAASSCFRATVWATHSTGTATVTYNWSFVAHGGALANSGTSFTDATSASLIVSTVYVCNNSGVQNAQTINQLPSTAQSNLKAAGNTTTSINTAASGGSDIAFTFNVANTDQVTPKAFVVERVQ